MPSLRILQQSFMDSILSRDGNIHPSLKNELPTTIHSRMQIYRNNNRMTLKDTLKDTYPVINRLVGDDFFNAMANVYIHQYPSTTPSLCNYGDKMAMFLASSPTGEQLPYLSDVATLEWAWRTASFAKAPQAFNWQQFNQLGASQLQQLSFFLPQGTTLISSQYPISTIFDFNQDQRADENSIDLQSGPDWLIVVPEEQAAQIVRLDKKSFTVLQAFAKQHTLAEVCGEILAEDDNELIASLIQMGLLGGFHAPATD